jgi:hypothetical protein
MSNSRQPPPRFLQHPPWEVRHPAAPWIPPPAPRIVNHGIQGGIFLLDKPDGQWLPVLKLQSKAPDAPSSEWNDHFRTIYVQASAGVLSASRDEETIRLGIVLRFQFGIGNGRMRTIYDVCPNGIIHAGVTGESVEVDAATVQIFYAADEEIVAETFDAPIPILASVPPTITIGVIQNQALAMNQIQTPKRSVNVETHSDATVRSIFVPPGAQSVEIVGDPLTVTAFQIFTADGTLGVPIEINEEVTILPGVWKIDVASAGGSEIVGVIFGLGI